MVRSLVDTQDLMAKHEIMVVDTNYKQSDFVHHSIEDVVRTQNMCEGWLRRAKEAKLLVAQAKQHLKNIKEQFSHMDHERHQRDTLLRQSLILPRKKKMMVEPLMMVENEDRLDLHELVERYDFENKSENLF